MGELTGLLNFSATALICPETSAFSGCLVGGLQKPKILESILETHNPKKIKSKNLKTIRFLNIQNSKNAIFDLKYRIKMMTKINI